MIRHRLPDIQTGVRFEVFQDRHHRRRIGDEGAELERPRQARAATLTGETADVFVLVPRPHFHHGEGAREIAFQEFPHREFGGTKAGEKLQRFHGGVEIVVPVEPHIVRQDEGDKSLVDAGGQLLQPAEGFSIIRRQRGMETFSHAAQALHQREVIQSCQGKPQEPRGIELRVQRRQCFRPPSGTGRHQTFP